MLCPLAVSILAAQGVALARAGEPIQRTPDHVVWVAEALKRMETVEPGMTRADLLRVFATQGGLSTGLRRTYAYRECPYFKVDVEFEAVARPPRAADGRVTTTATTGAGDVAEVT